LPPKGIEGDGFMENKLIEVDGKTVSYYESGDKCCPTIVLLHGLAGSAVYTFHEMTEHLEKEFHLLVIDQPGHGKSMAFFTEEDYLFENLAAWYGKILDKLLDRPYYIAGHSWGADVALHYTRDFGGKVKGLILLDGAITFPHYQEEMTYEVTYNGWKEYIRAAAYETWEQALDEFRSYTTNWGLQKEAALKTIMKQNGSYHLIASEFTILSIIKAFFAEPFYKVYPEIHSPVLLLLAEKPEELEAARKRGINQMRKDIDEVTIITLEGTGHMLQWDEPVKVSRMIREWILGKS
jgi:pimeloyl-ACP methyl ester carboxylesterase